MKIGKFLVIAFSLFYAFYPESVALEQNAVKLSQASGEVKILVSGESSWKKAEKGMTLHQGDSIKTARDSRASIVFHPDKENEVKIGPQAYVVLKIEENEKIELIDGEVFVVIKRLPPGSAFEVRTPIAIAGTRGTEYKVKSKKEESLTELSVFKNAVRLQSVKEPFKFVTVKSLQQRNICPWEKSVLQATGTGMLSKALLGPEVTKNAETRDVREISEDKYVKEFGAAALITTKRAASVDAYRKLAEKIYGVVIDSKTTLEDYAEKDSKVKITVNGIVKGAREIKVTYYSDGSVRVTMETKGMKVKKDLVPITGNIFGVDCISGPDTLEESSFKEFLI